MKKKINFSGIIAILSGILFVLLVIHFFKTEYSFDFSFEHTFGPGILLIISLVFSKVSIEESKKQNDVIIKTKTEDDSEENNSSSEDGFIEFFIGIAKKNNISKEDLRSFFHQNRSVLVLNYTLKLGSGKYLSIIDIEGMIKKAIKRY